MWLWTVVFVKLTSVGFKQTGSEHLRLKHNVVQNIIQTTPTLFHLSGDVTIGSFRPDGFVGIGVPIGTDTFVRNFILKHVGLL